jgi:hypothetical protein
MVLVAFSFLAAGAVAHAGQVNPSAPAVKVCALVSLAEMKKLAPWPANVEQHAKAEELSLPGRSLCVYPTAQVQVEPYREQILESARKTAQLDRVAGIGDAAYARNNKVSALIYAKVGPQLLTVEVDIPPGKTFENVKPTAIEIAKTFVTKLR